MYLLTNFPSRATATGADQALTSDGRPDLISHGVPDWVYEEEVFSDIPASTLWWSTGGSSLAWASFYDKNVKTFPLTTLTSPHWGAVSMNWNSLHGWEAIIHGPEVYRQRYPHAGQTNPRWNVSGIGRTTIF